MLSIQLDTPSAGSCFKSDTDEETFLHFIVIGLKQSERSESTALGIQFCFQ